MDSSGSAGQDVVLHQAKTQEFELGTQKHKVRMVGTEEDPWFVAEDIGKVLGVNQIGDYLKSYKKVTEKKKEDVLTPGGVQKMIVLSEMATYKFLMRSQKPEAEPFQEWLASVVRSIRLQGKYELHTTQSKLLQDAETARQREEAAKKEAADAKAALQKANEEKVKREELVDKLRRRIANKRAKGHTVYLLRNPAVRERSLWKVGRSQDLKNREAQYKTSMPEGPEFVHCRHTCNSALVEAIVHHIIDDTRFVENLEWFEGDPEYFAAILDMVVDFVDGLTEIGDKVVPFQLKDKLGSLIKNAKRFSPQDDEGNTSEGSQRSEGSVIVTGNNNNITNINVQINPVIIVSQFVTETLVREHLSLLPWTRLTSAFDTFVKDKTFPNEVSRFFLKSELRKHGVSYVSTHVNGKTFKGIKHWKLQ